jgi:hypothetical protein
MLFTESAAARPTALMDFDHDGRADIVWRNASTGQNYLYPMNGTQILGSEGYLRTVADSNWKIAGVGDFDGNGRADILWRNAATGENYIYLMDGTSIIGEGYIRTVADLSWQVGGTGDFDGDGKDDILWRSTVPALGGSQSVNGGDGGAGGAASSPTLPRGLADSISGNARIFLATSSASIRDITCGS